MPSAASSVQGLSRSTNMGNWTNGDDSKTTASPPGSSDMSCITMYSPASAPVNKASSERLMALELQDGTVFQGYGYGASRSVSGELVFQTGMVGYCESLTDPSYRGQILVLTFPLIGNYGVPSRDALDELLGDLPAYFESREIHIAALVTASYAGEDYSHYLAESSLGTWLEEQGVPAIHGVDTRALTKRIREEGSMLGRLIRQKSSKLEGDFCGQQLNASRCEDTANAWRDQFEHVEWSDPNVHNLVADGKQTTKESIQKKARGF